MPDPRKGRFAPYLRALGDALNLKDWEVRLVANDPGEDALAAVSVPDGHWIASVLVGDDFLESDAETQREALTHELIHVHWWEADSTCRDELEDSALRAYNRAAERAVQALARVLAPFLPLPPSEDGADEDDEEGGIEVVEAIEVDDDEDGEPAGTPGLNRRIGFRSR